MADKKISDFPTLADAQDEDLVLVSSQSQTYNMKVKTLKDATSELAREASEQAASAVKQARASEQTANNAKAAASNAVQEVADTRDNVVALETQQKAMSLELLGKVDGGYVENGYLYLTSNDEVVVGPLGPFSSSGGGGGGSNNAVLTLTNTSGWLSKTIAYGSACKIQAAWTSLEDDIPTGNGVAKITVNGIVKALLDVAQGNIEIDPTPYLSSGVNAVKLNISDVYGNSRTINYSINAIAISLSSAFDASSPFTGAINFTYVPVGSLTKTMHFVLDGTEIGTVETAVSGRQQTYTIPAQAHGAHALRAYFTALVDGQEVRSNELYYELICVTEGNQTPIIATNFSEATVEQFGSIVVQYTVYDPSSLTADIVLKANGMWVNALTVDRTRQSWTYRADIAGDLTLSIVCSTVEKQMQVTVTPSSINVEAETQDLSLYLSSYGRSNNEANPGTWEYCDIAAQFAGFNFTSDGWQMDKDGNTVLRVSGDARLTIPLKLFASDFRSTGKTIELEFSTRNVLNYDAVVLSCLSGGRGLSLTAQKATLKSEQSEISTQYKEDEHVRISFVVEKRAEHRLIYCYINGIMSRVIQYPDDDDFSQAAPVDITIGSNDCTMDLYCIRVYDNNLTRFQVLNNWIADTQDAGEMLARYSRNNVFDEYGQIVINQLPKNLPYLILEATELPQFKGDKKTVQATYTDPTNSANNFTSADATADVQGTSSQYYVRKNYKIKFSGGFVHNGLNSPDYKLRDDSIGVNTFTFKADVASSEGANNVELVRLYNDANPVKTPPQLSNPSVRQGIDGFPIVIFWNDGVNTTFLGKYNFNNDKGTPEVFGFDENDESWEILNNTSDRVLWKSADFSVEDWKQDFEARYPEDSTNITRLQAFAAWLASTDQSAATGSVLDAPVTYDTGKTDSEGNSITVTYTEDTAAYRLAKFRAELADHADVDGMLFNYLFTELFLMVDNRAKNAFPTYYDNGKWTILPYDFDTAMGTNNEGALVFDYSLEDIDQTETGADVFNGQASVLYVNLRQGFFDELAAMYQKLRSEKKLSYEDTESRFEAHQSKWPEAIFNEDAQFKYLDPLIELNNASYLSMLQGSKTEQRKWWLYNRFRYLDSKYNAGDALTDYITLRGYAKADLSVTPYADIYATIKYGSYLVQKRAKRGISYVLECPLDNVNDTETYIYSASQLAALGDLSGYKVGYADFTAATKLQTLKIGDASDSYSNENLLELYLGNNTLLRSLDVRNCPNLGTGPVQQAVDLSGCVNLEHVWFDGTSVTGVSLPNGGILKTLHLPGTITNLTIRNQGAIDEFVCPSYSQIATLRLENVSPVVDGFAILDAMAAGSRVRIIGFDMTADSAEEILSFYDKLDTMRGLDENGNNTDKPQMSGTIRVASLTGAQLAEMQSRYPNIRIVYQHITSYLYFYSDDGTTLLQTVSIQDGADGAYTGSTPTKASTAQYAYAFAGWSMTPGGSADADTLKAVTADRSVYAVFTATVRTYTVTWKNGSTVLETDTDQPYGTTPAYNGATPVDPDGEEKEFIGWSPTIGPVTGNVTYVAQFKLPWDWIAPPVDVSNAYAVQWNYAESSTKLQRGGVASGFAAPAPATSLTSMGSSPFDSVLPWSGMKRYNIIDGAVAYSEDDAGFSMTDHDTMVYIPEFYFYAHKDTENKRWTWAISAVPLEGFTKHPGSGRYIGRYHTSGDSSAVFSKSGIVPLVNTSRTNFRTYSHNKGDKWWMLDIATWSALQMLFLIEYADFNSQNILGRGYGSSSQKSGASDGAIYHTVNGGNTYNQYRWVEQPFGRVFDWVDGFMASSRNCYLGADNATFADSTSALTAAGVKLPSSNYITGFGYSEELPWAFLPDAASGGSASTFVPDYVYSSSDTDALYVGGGYGSGGDYGFWYFYANSSASYTNGYLGSRLLYIP